jgi:hypothetical protein
VLTFRDNLVPILSRSIVSRPAMLSHPARRETGELPVQAAMKYDTVAHQVAINRDAALVTSSHTGKSTRRRPVVR